MQARKSCLSRGKKKKKKKKKTNMSGQDKAPHQILVELTLVARTRYQHQQPRDQLLKLQSHDIGCTIDLMTVQSMKEKMIGKVCYGQDLNRWPRDARFPFFQNLHEKL
jgi:hypothetical protein